MRLLRWILVASVLLLPAHPLATTFPVTKTDDTDDGLCDADCSLREAIAAANASPGADDVPVPAGTYLLALGQLVVSDEVTIAGAGQASTVIDADADYYYYNRVFYIQSGTIAQISGVTIQNGFEPYSGGGIFNRGDLTLIDSAVIGNYATDFLFQGTGGGIQNSLGTLTVINSTVSGNLVHGFGGGIFNRSGTVNLIDTTVRYNSSGDGGGGIENSGGILTLTNSTVSGNLSRSDYFQGSGGGIRGSATLINSTVSGNSTGYFGYRGQGGGISGNATLINSTVSGNQADDGGGIRGNTTLVNSIVAGNDGTNNCAGGVSSLGYNLSDDDSCNLTAPGDLVVADALLGPLADNGGPTRTHALLPGSPAIDAGSADCPPPATDQRGVIRPQGAGCDIGAFEAEAGIMTPTPTPTPTPTITPTPPLAVRIDIKPDSENNIVNLGSGGALPVAILGSETFDVEDVDVTTLAFGPAGALPKHDLTDPKVFRQHHVRADGDRFKDLLSHYTVGETGIAAGDVEACLTGRMLDGTAFEGCDAVRTLSRGGPRRK